MFQPLDQRSEEKGKQNRKSEGYEEVFREVKSRDCENNREADLMRGTLDETIHEYRCVTGICGVSIRVRPRVHPPGWKQTGAAFRPRPFEENDVMEQWTYLLLLASASAAATSSAYPFSFGVQLEMIPF